jgi:hypothetical protein
MIFSPGVPITCKSERKVFRGVINAIEERKEKDKHTSYP